MLDEKLTRLPAEARGLLEVIAVAGQSIDLREVAAVAGHEVPPTATFSRMRSERLIRFVGAEHTRSIDTYHDRIRETVLAEMGAAATKAIHGNLAEYLERVSGGLGEEQIRQIEAGTLEHESLTTSHRVFDLSFHFDAAGMQRKAFAYSVLAAEQARKQFALEVAATQYRVARRNFGHCKDAARRRVLVGLGETSMLLARYQEADACLREAHHLADKLLDRCEIELILGELLRLDSHYADSAEQFTATLRELGQWIPATLPGLLAGISKEALVQIGHTLARYPRRSTCQANRKQLLINRLMHGLTMSLWFRSTPSVLWGTLSSLNRCERQGPSVELAEARIMHGAICAVGGLYSRGIRYLDNALELLGKEDLASRFLNYVYRAVAHYSAGRYDRCQETAAQGLEIGERRGDLWRAAIIRVHVALSDYRLGNLGNACQQAREEFDISIRLGDRNTSRDHLNLIAMLTRGNFPFEEMAANLIPVPDNYQATNQELQAAARWHLFHGRTREGLDLAQQAYDLMMKQVVINHITSPNFPLLLAALRQRADALKTQDPTASDRLLRRGYRHARWAARLTKNLPDYPATLRELSRYQTLRGQRRRAIKTANKSLQISDTRKMRYESALTCLVLAEYQYQLGVVDAAEVEWAETAVQDLNRNVDCVHV